MVWGLLFAISIAQGIFLISLISIKKSNNALASQLLIAMLVLMICTNMGYLVIRTELVNYIPQFFGIPFGMMLLFGPLFYFYSKAVTDNTFYWKKKYWLHFIPYFIQLFINFPFLIADKAIWHQFLNLFFSGNLPIRSIEKVTFAIQDLHFLTYLIVTFRWIKLTKTNSFNQQYLVSISERLKWLTSLTLGFSIFLATVFSMYLFILVNGKYNPVTNYLYTLITSGIIYFIAYKLVLNPGLISPDFVKKYKTYKQFENSTNQEYIRKLKTLLEEKKIYTDPDLKLGTLAAELNLPQYQVSKLINQSFNKTFNDLINEYRVQEFILRVNDSRYKALTVYGIALDVGFNSKSSFNSTFKKLTGKTPSEYKNN